MATNAEIINAILSDAGYEDRFPTATEENYKEIGTMIIDQPNVKNDFINTLTNKIGLTAFLTKVYSNPLKDFKKGELPYGQTIEQIFTDIIKAKDYSQQQDDNVATEVLGKADENPVKVEYKSENFRHKYKITVSNVQLTKAFQSKNGLSTLVNELVAVPVNSAEFDEYLQIKGLVDTASYAKEVIVADPTSSGGAKALVKTLRTYARKLAFLSTKYNKMGVHTFSKAEDLHIITTPEVEAELDVELLAQVFNITKAEVPTRMTIVDSFGDKDRVAVLVDKDFIQYYTTLSESRNQENPATLFNNVWYHVWGIVAQCDFANAIDFRTLPQTEMEIS